MAGPVGQAPIYPGRFGRRWSRIVFASVGIQCSKPWAETNLGRERGVLGQMQTISAHRRNEMMYMLTGASEGEFWRVIDHGLSGVLLDDDLKRQVVERRQSASASAALGGFLWRPSSFFCLCPTAIDVH